MDLSFSLTGDDVLNTTIRDSMTGSIMYTIETSKSVGGFLTTTATRRNQIDGSTRFAFRIVWVGTSLGDAMVVLDHNTLEEVPVRQVLEKAPGTTTYGSVYISGVEHKWKSKGTGSKVVLVNKNTKQIVAESHSMIRNSFFRKPRDMSLDISHQISPAVDIVLLTFILAWTERQSEKVKHGAVSFAHFEGELFSPLPVEGSPTFGRVFF